MITVQGLYKSFEGHTVLDGIELEVAEGELLALIGRSGTGKSVLLKNIAALLRPDRGSIRVAGEDICSLRGRRLARLRERMGYLFQEGALFDSLNLYDNTAFVLREKSSLDEERIRDRVMSELDRMGLAGDAGKYSAELSGGMRKRAALARALVTDPSIMLFDEPTTGLDPESGLEILRYMRECHRSRGFTGIVVTHDVPRIFDIVHKVAMLDGGRIVVAGEPDKVHAMGNPAFERFCSGEQV